ncbi:MAG: 50S ribosomal protein L24 [Clostridia bacterium]|nr:50S ribosomal protein L24 [Clostridia bacterium]
MARMHVQKGDLVFVRTGKDGGKTGKILKVDPDKGRVLVEGVNLVTKHKKPRGRGQQGGIIEQEAFISASNVMLVCSQCKRPSKTGRKILENGEKVRYCKACGEIIDTIRQARR